MKARNFSTAPPANSLRDPGDHGVDIPIISVITRFHLRNARYLLLTYLDYRRVITQVNQTQIPGFLRAAFLIESPTACYSLSLWSGRDAIAVFGTNVTYHVNAAHRVFGRLTPSKYGGPEIWSTKWQISSVSNNLNWRDLDLRGLILSLSE